MNEHTWTYDKLWHACQNALYVIDFMLARNQALARTRGADDDEKRLTRVAEELRAALEYHEGIDERLKP